MTVRAITSDTHESRSCDKLRKGLTRIHTSSTVYWTIGENPVANKNCAVLQAGASITLRIPVNCSKLAVLAVQEPGTVSVTELSGGARASCSY